MNLSGQQQILMNIEQFSQLLVGIICLIILYSLIGNYLEHKNLHFIHETGAGIVIGIIFGLFLYFVADVEELKFSEEIFFYGLLPPMIFAGGYNLKKKNFGKNITYILVYAVIGTIVSFAITFGLTYVVSQLHWIITLRSENQIESLQTSLIVKYSATISASDSVASLTLLKASEFPKLFSIIFGEGLINDAVAIILYNVVGGLFDRIDSQMTAGEILKTILGSFLGNVFISVAIGVLTALLCSYLFKRCRFLVENEVTQVAFTYIFGILSYVMAEFFGMSGVITVLISGIVLAHYNYYNLTVGGMHATTVTFQSISFLAEAIVFVYLGVSTVYYFLKETISFSFLGLEFAIVVIARIVTIFGISAICRRLIKKWTITNKQLSIVAVGGTIRGSVAFALILTIEPSATNANQVSVIKSTTLGLVCFTTIVLGGLMPRVISCFLGKSKSQLLMNEEHRQRLPENERKLLEENQREHVEKKKKKKKKPSFFKYSDENYWRPYFIYRYQERKEIFKLYKRIMKYNNRDQYQGGNFYLLDLVGADHQTQAQFVDKIEQQEKQHLVPIEEEPHRLQSDEGISSPRVLSPTLQKPESKIDSRILNNSRI